MKEKLLSTNFDHHPNMSKFMQGVQKTLVEQPDYGGMGVHGVENHGSHGSHSQTIIRVGNRQVNFRELK